MPVSLHSLKSTLPRLVSVLCCVWGYGPIRTVVYFLTLISMESITRYVSLNY